MGLVELLTVTNRLGRHIRVLATDPRGHALVGAGGDLNPQSLAMWNQVLAAGRWDLVIDIGANYGEMVLGAVLPHDAHIVLYEPHTAVAQCLRDNVTAARLVCDVREVAVSSTPGSVPFLADASWSGTSRVVAPAELESDEVRMVPAIALDQEFTDTSKRHVVMKIDVEGHDLQVLDGAERILRNSCAAVAMVEILHMDEAVIAELSRQYHLYFFASEERQFVRVAAATAEDITRYFETGCFYRQDALVSHQPLGECLPNE